MQRRPPRGFTLIELVVTVTILAVLALGVLPVAELSVKRAREQELRLALRQIRSAIDAYKQAADAGRVVRAADATGYPPTLEVLSDGLLDVRSPDKRKIYFLRRVPRDPMLEDGDRGGWGLRSYASSADAPLPGKDVFDVYSRSDGVGLNGVPYREW